MVQSSDIGQYKVPSHLAFNHDNECVYVVDSFNRRVTLLSPTLDYIREVVSCDKLKGLPARLHLDVKRRRLYVVESKVKDDKSTSGRAMVFSV